MEGGDALLGDLPYQIGMVSSTLPSPQNEEEPPRKRSRVTKFCEGQTEQTEVNSEMGVSPPSNMVQQSQKAYEYLNLSMAIITSLSNGYYFRFPYLVVLHSYSALVTVTCWTIISSHCTVVAPRTDANCGNNGLRILPEKNMTVSDASKKIVSIDCGYLCEVKIVGNITTFFPKLGYMLPTTTTTTSTRPTTTTTSTRPTTTSTTTRPTTTTTTTNRPTTTTTTTPQTTTSSIWMTTTTTTIRPTTRTTTTIRPTATTTTTTRPTTTTTTIRPTTTTSTTTTTSQTTTSSIWMTTTTMTIRPTTTSTTMRSTTSSKSSPPPPPPSMSTADSGKGKMVTIKPAGLVFRADNDVWAEWVAYGYVFLVVSTMSLGLLGLVIRHYYGKRMRNRNLELYEFQSSTEQLTHLGQVSELDIYRTTVLDESNRNRVIQNDYTLMCDRVRQSITFTNAM